MFSHCTGLQRAQQGAGLGAAAKSRPAHHGGKATLEKTGVRGKSSHLILVPRRISVIRSHFFTVHVVYYGG